MDTALVIVAVASSVTSCIVSCIHAWIAYKKSKEPPKDEIWETATRLVCANGQGADADEFAETYEELKLFKESGYSIPAGHKMLLEVVREKRLESSLAEGRANQ